MDDLEVLMYKGWYDFITKALPSENVYLFNTGFVAPQGNYTTVNFNAFEPVSDYTLWQSDPDPDTALRDYFSTYNCFMTLRFIGEQSLSRAQSIVAATRESSIRRILQDSGIAFRRTAPVRDASRPIDGQKIEKVATVSVEYYFTHGGEDRGDAVSTIEEATVSDQLAQIYRNWNENP